MPGNGRRPADLDLDADPGPRPFSVPGGGRPANLAEMASQVAELTGHVANLVRVVGALSDEQDKMAILVGQNHARSTRSKGEQIDAPWPCQKCGALIGYYDRATETVRIRMKFGTCRGRAGVGGFLSVDCRGCGEINTIAHTPGDGEAIAVRGGVSILSAEYLAELLAKAREQGGLVEVQIVETPVGDVDTSDLETPVPSAT